jgi:hypothetical protein
MGRQPNDRPEERVDLWPVPELALAPKPAQAVADEDTPLNRLLRVFESHTAAETDAVVEYRRLAETSADPTVALLMQLVVEDEDRHHGLLQRMSSRLHDALDWTHSADALPTDKAPAVKDRTAAVTRTATLAAIREFARHEREGARQLREIAKKQRDLYGGLFSLILQIMAMDSEKHETILRFIDHRLTEQE